MRGTSRHGAFRGLRRTIPALPVALLLFAGAAAAQTRDQPERSVPDAGIVTTRQVITPAGVQSIFEGRVYGVAFGPTAGMLWVLTGGDLHELDWATNAVKQRIDTFLTPGPQSLCFDRTGGRALVAGASRVRRTGKPPAVVFGAAHPAAPPVPEPPDGMPAPAPAAPPADQRTGATPAPLPVLTSVAEGLGWYIAGAISVAPRARPDGRRLALVPLIYDNAVAVIDVENSEILGSVRTAIAPFGAVIDDTGTVAWVSNWGGRVPEEGERWAPAGDYEGADRILVDERGVAALGTVVRIDLKSMEVTDTIEVGPHSTALAWDQARNRLYVALGNDDAVEVIDTSRRRKAGRVEISPFGREIRGTAPTALALSSDGSRLYVACGGINAVAAIDTAALSVLGLIPTAWYPDSLALSPDGKMLAVGALLGVGSGWRRPATPSLTLGTPAPTHRYVHANRGSVSVLPVPTDSDLVNCTMAVAENNRLPLAAREPAPSAPSARLGRDARARQPRPAPTAVPLAAGDPSLIEHVVYIIKENRTYDQVFGDLPKGNGDPTLALFGEDVAPNQRRLAREFVLLDNFFATGGNSGDGHQWVTQADESDYAIWPGYLGRSYPKDGADALAPAQGGFIWDAARKARKSVRVFGEYLPAERRVAAASRADLLQEWAKGADFTNRWKPTPHVQGLRDITASDFPSYTLAIPDVIRADIFLRDLRKWEQGGKMPNLVIMLLPSNHTYGTSAGLSTPQAMVADNDLALGRVVEGLSRSRFWPKMAVFVVEDDAQDGVDHVDGHRTVAQVISPYSRRGHVDSTFYAQPSILKTIELILGLQPLSIFDRIANDMRASFTDQADTAPYTAVVPKQSIHDLTPRASSLQGAAREAAIDSARMRFDEPDAAPTDRLNRYVWHAIKGWDVPYPGVRRAVFAPLSVDLDDDERQEAKPGDRDRR